ncbi:hypothetical protein [Actinocorallia longicatena]|uniref:DUF222 domain-containing protein n=1 Tax=Actinocorallia longicatena TaxID=111803 RepID=A0ABP6QHU8_9ACTN
MGVLGELARRCAFGDLAALARAGVAPAEILGTCEFGKQLLELDAEDFGDADPSVPGALVERARQIRMPQEPRESVRGALASMRPAYALLLEVIAIRWARREMAGLVAAAHIASEYLHVLAWEPVLGHGADPARLGERMAVPGSRFGIVAEAEHCEHTRGVRAACDRSLRVSKEPGEGWRAYLDRQHSQMAKGLGVCAAECRTPCTPVTGLPERVRIALADRNHLAREFADGALVKLRHAAPVGHGFGVPSQEELQDAWARSRTSLSKHALFHAAPDPDPDFPLKGLPQAFTAVAAAKIAPSTLLHDVSLHLQTLLPDD